MTNPTSDGGSEGPEPTLTWGATGFVPGPDVGLVGRDTIGLVAVGDDAASVRARLWPLVSADAPLDDLLDALSHDGIKRLPDLALAQVEDSWSVRLVVRGRGIVRIGDPDGGERTIDAAGVRTWREEVVEGVAWIDLSVERDDAEHAVDDADGFVVVAGSVPAGSLRRRFDTAGATSDPDEGDAGVFGAPGPSTGSGATGAAAGPAATDDSGARAGGDADGPSAEGPTSTTSEAEADDAAPVTTAAEDPPAGLTPPTPTGRPSAPGATVEIGVVTAEPGEGHASEGTGTQTDADGETGTDLDGESPDVDPGDADPAVTEGDEDGERGIPGSGSADDPARPADTVSSRASAAWDGAEIDVVNMPTLAGFPVEEVPDVPTSDAVGSSVDGRPDTTEFASEPELVADPGITAIPASDEAEVMGGLEASLDDLDGEPVVRAVLAFDSGERVPVDRSVLIGRNPKITGTVEAELPRIMKYDGAGQGVSRTHAEVRIDGTDLVIEDLDSTNGTEVETADGETEAVPAGRPVVIGIGSVVVLGDELRFEVVAPDADGDD